MSSNAPETSNDRDAVQREALAFRDQFKSLLLATCSADGRPEISYAPFILGDDQAFHLFISELAAHTRNLRHNGQASVMLIEAENQAKNPFARKRLTLQCHAQEVPPEAQDELLERFETRFGNTVKLLRQLPDFHLFCLTVAQGSYVRGFGQAWALAGNGLEVLQLRQG